MRPWAVLFPLVLLSTSTLLNGTLALLECPEGWDEAYSEGPWTSSFIPGPNWSLGDAMGVVNATDDIWYLGHLQRFGESTDLDILSLPEHQETIINIDVLVNNLRWNNQGSVIVKVDDNAHWVDGDGGEEFEFKLGGGLYCPSSSCYSTETRCLSTAGLISGSTPDMGCAQVSNLEDALIFDDVTKSVWTGDEGNCPFCEDNPFSQVFALQSPKFAHYRDTTSLRFLATAIPVDGYAGIAGVRVCTKPVTDCEPNEDDLWYEIEEIPRPTAFDSAWETGTRLTSQDYQNLEPGSGYLEKRNPGNENEDAAWYRLPFPFQWFCDEVDGFYITHTGSITFTPNAVVWPSQDADALPANLAPYWAHTFINSDDSSSDHSETEIYIKDTGEDAVHISIVDVTHVSRTDRSISWGVTLHRDGTLDIHWMDMSATDNFSNDEGDYSYMSGFSPGTLIEFFGGLRDADPLGEVVKNSDDSNTPTLRLTPLVEVIPPGSTADENEGANWPLIIGSTLGVLAVIGIAGAALMTARSSSSSSSSSSAKQNKSQSKSGGAAKKKLLRKDSAPAAHKRSASPVKGGGGKKRSASKPAPPSSSPPPMPKHARPPTEKLDEAATRRKLDRLAAKEAAARQ